MSISSWYLVILSSSSCNSLSVLDLTVLGEPPNPKQPLIFQPEFLDVFVFYVKTHESPYLGNVTSNEKERPLFIIDLITPQNLRKLNTETTSCHSKVFFRLLLCLYKTRIFSPKGLILKFWVVIRFTMTEKWHQHIFLFYFFSV